MSRIILITGCSSGIGHALAKGFAQNGDTVIATARNRETLTALEEAGCEIHGLDVNDGAGIDALTAHIEARHGHLDVLVNNAGVAAMGPMIEVPVEVMRETLETNTIAPMVMAQKCLRLLRLADRPVILQIGSVSGVLTTPFAGTYCASKAAIQAMMEALRLELAPFGVRVVVVQPGGITSDIGNKAEAGVARWLSGQSLYAPIRERIMKRAQLSQVNSTPAEDFTADVIRRLDTDPTEVWRIGNNSHAIITLARQKTARRSKILSKQAGLDAL